MFTEEVYASLLLNSIPEIGPKRFQSLIEIFGSAHSALKARATNWRSVPFFEQHILEKIESQFVDIQRAAENDLEVVNRSGVKVFLAHQGDYPALLKQTVNPPPVLYVKGADILAQQPAIAMVGSRRCSYYGEKMATTLAGDLSAFGITTISGLARGIDTFAHRASLAAGGETWAVIGAGLSRIYPPENSNLAAEIEKRGAIISEFPMATRPLPANFPRRNRVIAGFAQATIVIEGTARSGSLITARLAAEQGRDVFAVPGPVTSPLSEAPHQLLQMGAAMAVSAEQVLRDLGISVQKQAAMAIDKRTGDARHSETFRRVLSFLGEETVPREILAQKLNCTTSQLSSLLLQMEMAGIIRSVPGGGVLKS